MTDPSGLQLFTQNLGLLPNYFQKNLVFYQIICPNSGFLPHHSSTGTSPEIWEKQE